MWVSDETSAWSPVQISLSLWQLLPRGILKIFKLCLIEHVAPNEPTVWVLRVPWGLQACFRIIRVPLSISAARYFGQRLHDPSALCLQLLENRGLGSDQWLSLQRCWGLRGVFGHLEHVFSDDQITSTVSTLKPQDYTRALKIYSWVLWFRPTVPTLKQPKPKGPRPWHQPRVCAETLCPKWYERRKPYKPVNYGCRDIMA